MSGSVAAFIVAFVALYVGHVVADHWVQTERQAADKGLPGAAGRWAAARHVGWLTLVQGILLAIVVWRLDIHLALPAVVAGLALNAVTHWWADRRSTLKRLAVLVGHGPFYEFGPGLGGAYALDQAWHIGWLFIAALVMA